MSTVSKKTRVSRTSNKGSQKVNGSRNGYKSVEATENEDNIDDSQQCVICAEQIIYGSYTPCNHVTCHKCSLRQRVLYGKDVCLVCRSANETVIISRYCELEYSEFGELPEYDEKYKIYFSTDEVKEDCMSLLEYRCSLRDCGEKFDTFKQLQDHSKSMHNKFFCLICYNNKKAFISELALYFYKPLQTHQTVGDGKGFKGHPACKHCIKKRFYSEDELNIHIRDAHERCHICDQHSPKIADYYKNYDSLYDHFKADHYVCGVQLCLDQKFVVFRDELDLAAHMLEVHSSLVGGNKMTIGGTRAFRSQLSTFQANSGSSSHNNANGMEEADSYTIKKMRFEERAKHYLHGQSGQMKDFLQMNEAFKSNSIDANEVADGYKELFTKQTTEEIIILLTEFSELFTESNARHASLKEVIKSISKKASDSEFPILGGRIGSPGPAVNLHGWGGSSSSRNASTDRFPALAKPNSSSKVPQVAANPKVRYATITKQPKAKPVVKQAPNLNYRPNYLERQSSSSSVSSQGSSTTKPVIPDSKFPPLEKKVTKKSFPRVNPGITAPAAGWNSIPFNDTPAVSNDWGVPIIEKKKKKKTK